MIFNFRILSGLAEGKQANGLAQRQRRDGRDAFTIIASLLETRSVPSAAKPLSALSEANVSAGIYPDGGPSFTPQ
jgi:hypothetical protein